MLMQAEMPQEERERFCKRWVQMTAGFERLDRSGQVKVMNRAANLHWRKMSKMVHGRLNALKMLCRILNEQEEAEIAELIEKETANV